MKKADVVVIGAGSAGSVTARRCAEMGLRTVLMDRKPRFLVGQKVCGDEISKSHFDATGIDYPELDEISSSIDGADVYPPSLDNELRVRGWTDFDGWTVHRLNFGQRLLNDAMRAGVEFLSDCHATMPMMRGDQVVGIEYKELDEKEEKKIDCKLVIDASGFAGVIKRKIDSDLIEKKIEKSDVALCYREIVKLKSPMDEPEIAGVFLGGKYAPSGYAWVFPKGLQEVNVGVGITGGEGKGSPKPYYFRFKDEYPLLADCEVLEAGGGAVPVRRPLKSLVANGIAFVGDSALQVNPIHGGGIGAGMRAGIILGEVAKRAIARRELTAKGLWHYNLRFQSGFGQRLASLEIFKRLLQDVSDEEMNFGFEKRLLEADDLMAANRGDGLSFSMFEKLKRVKRGIGNIRLLRKLQRAASLMKEMSKVYREYPSNPEGLEQWNNRVLEIVQSADFK
ncbi:MAG: geranylgeranyl reductase family protein [Candidatus Lokiarchaeota archaeon]|nr:geranylgeranyl reductase family protein [Candidatus Lokiarchaeota archaeon]